MDIKRTILFEGPVDTCSGYGAHARDILKSIFELYNDDFNIVVNPTPWGVTQWNALNPKIIKDKQILDSFINLKPLLKQPEIFIQVSVPNEFKKVGQYINIGVTAGIETTLASGMWVEGCNVMDLVIVPSEHSYKVFKESKWEKRDNTNKNMGLIELTTKMSILFEGIDTEIYNKNSKYSEGLNGKLDSIKEEYIFLSVGHWLPGDLGEDRKNIGMVVKTFLDAFKGQKDAPALCLKTSSGRYSHIDYTHIRGKIDSIINKYFRDVEDLPSIYILHGDLTDDEMNSLYNHDKIKAMVSFCHAEGYGRPLAEFAASGKPILVSNWSGHLDFLSPKYTILLNGSLKKVHKSASWENVILEESQWFGVDYNDAKFKMIDVYKNYDKYLSKSKIQGEIISKKFNLSNMTIKMGEMFSEYFDKVPKQMQLKLPTLKKL